MRKSTFVSISAILLMCGGNCRATPFFARQYGMACRTCHNGFPRLNEFGLAFKANNFRVPGNETKAILAWQKSVPLAVRVKPTQLRFYSNPGSGKFEFTDTQLLAGGLITRRTAFYIHHSLFFDGVPNDFPTYEAWIQHVMDERHKVMIKAGQFELPYAFSTGINQTTINAPSTFFSVVNGNDVTIGLPINGLQMSGADGARFQWYLAGGAPVPFNGSTVGRRNFIGEFRDFFARIATGALSRNAGFFVLFAQPLRNPNDESTGDRERRLGVDGQLFWKGIQFQGEALYGDNANPRGDGKRGFIRGAFLEADRMFLPWLGLTGRLDVRTIATSAGRAYNDAKTISLRLYPHGNLKFQAEYQRLSRGRETISFLADVAF